MRHTALVVLLGMAGPALARAQQVPAGGEFQVNTYTSSEQWVPSASLDADGDMVVAWLSAQDGYNVFGQRFDAAGQRAGGEFMVNTYASPLNLAPRVASSARGDFVVVWLFNGPTSTDSWRVRRFRADGTPQGPEASGTSLRSRSPDVAADPAGNFVIAWHELGFYNSGWDVRAQRFDASGTRLGAEFQVNTYTTSDQRGAAVAMDAAGNFVVVWRSMGQDGSGYGIFGRRFAASGAPLGDEFRANSYTTADQRDPDVAAAADGSFVVAWHGYHADESGVGVFGQRFDQAGVPQGVEFRVNTYTTSDQFYPRVAGDAPGNFVVVWTSFGQDGWTNGVFGQRFARSGARRGSEFRLNTTTFESQFASAAASDPQGNLLVSWSSMNQDGSSWGVFGQRFGGLQPAALAVDTTRNGVFEPGEVVDIAPSWRNVNGAAQTFGGTAVAFTGPAPAVYQVNTPFANYSTVPNGETRRCLDCYRVAVPSTARPLLHWDAVFDERLTPDVHGQEKLWTVHLGASFADVPSSSPFYGFVETLLHHGVTGGCNPADYCAAASTAREQMAVFVLVGKEGAAYRPPACGTPRFADVPASSPFCPFIEELARRGVVAGCGSGSFCPGAAVSREQMPVFVLRTLDPALDPPACGTPRFADVPASSPFCRWIEELARRGVVTGCGGGNYCPSAPVTREQMAVFIAGTFGLALYGP